MMSSRRPLAAGSLRLLFFPIVSLALFWHSSRLFIQRILLLRFSFKMNPQSFLRPLRLLQQAPNRSFLPVGLGRRALSSSSRVPDFAFAFEYVSPGLFYLVMLL